jgi:TonB family protein
MKIMQLKMKRMSNSGLAFLLATGVFCGITTRQAIAQHTDPIPATKSNSVSYDELEQIQDRIEDLNISVYKIRYRYPEVSYHFVSERGETPEVQINGMPDNTDRQRLNDYLVELQKKKDRIFNLSNRVGIFYVTETDPEPKAGYQDFYDILYRNLNYPESAMEHGVEGNIMVKFIVDEEGQVSNVTAMDEIETAFTADLKELRMAAKNAVRETSGDWIPAKANGRPVQHWVSIPVQFRIENPLHLMPM